MYVKLINFFYLFIYCVVTQCGKNAVSFNEITLLNKYVTAKEIWFGVLELYLRVLLLRTHTYIFTSLTKYDFQTNIYDNSGELFKNNKQS